MIVINFDLPMLYQRFRGCPRKAQRKLRKVLSKHGNKILSSVRRRKTLFDRTNTHKGQPSLQRSVWTEQTNKAGEHIQAMGWDVEHGPVLEYGPLRKRRWIVPGPVRWKVGAKVQWAERVERKWSRNQLRPHFVPAVNRIEPKFINDVCKVLVESVEGR